MPLTLATAASAQLTPWAAPAPGTVHTDAGSGIFCLLVVLFVVAIVLWLYLRNRVARRQEGGIRTANPNPTDPYVTMPTQQLSADANARLVAADDSLKTSEQELAYATAQYGPEPTAELTTALAQSRADVTAAFHVRQMLDDDVPDSEDTKRGRYAQIIERCRAAGARLDAQVGSFDKLRDLEAKVETLIPAVVARRDAAAFRLPQAQAAYVSLEQRYAPSAILAISNSSAQAEERIDFADRTLGQATDALDAGNRQLAALAVRAAEDALGQVDMIFESVERLSADLDVSAASVTAALAVVESDVAAGHGGVGATGAGAGVNASGSTVDLAAAVAGASQVTESIRAELAAGQTDPFGQLRRLGHADARLSAALANIRDAAGRAERARVMAEQAIPAARAEISAVASFITTRRGAVGRDARTRLTEAERHLAHALEVSDSDPIAALTAAQQADALAEQAGRMANEEVDDWSAPTFGNDGVSVGGLGGAVLGGILVEEMLGGAGRRRGPGPGRDLGWGDRVPGSFGGPQTRVRVRF